MFCAVKRCKMYCCQKWHLKHANRYVLCFVKPSTFLLLLINWWKQWWSLPQQSSKLCWRCINLRFGRFQISNMLRKILQIVGKHLRYHTSGHCHCDETGKRKAGLNICSHYYVWGKIIFAFLRIPQIKLPSFTFF